jgi:hypothetical protein
MYQTDELELASFLKARGHKLLGAELRGYLVAFNFADSAAEDVSNYFAGTELGARDLFEAHRSLRTLIVQVKQHSTRRSGTEKEIQNERSYRH